MNNLQIEEALKAFDLANSQDPNLEIVNGKEVPKELIYGQRMTEVLNNFDQLTVSGTLPTYLPLGKPT